MTYHLIYYALGKLLTEGPREHGVDIRKTKLLFVYRGTPVYCKKM